MTTNKLLKNRIIYAFCITFCLVSISFVSCTTEATLKAQKDGSVQITFTGACGAYFENMFRSFAGDTSDAPLFDAAELKESFIADGFTNVDVKTPTNVSVETKMTDPGTSFLFKSGLLSCDKKNVTITLSPKILQELYNLADEQTMTILDLFIAPVFNDEIMTEEEYLEIISSFYGIDAANEIKKCDLKIKLLSVNGKQREVNLPLAKLLTLQEELIF